MALSTLELGLVGDQQDTCFWSLIEDEFYEVETFNYRDDFLAKSTTYTFWFNSARKNSYKGNKTPWDIVQERNLNISPDIVALPTFYLDRIGIFIFFMRFCMWSWQERIVITILYSPVRAKEPSQRRKPLDKM